MTSIIIGHADSKPVKIDLLKLVDSRLLIQANSGGGKSWFLRLLIERAAKEVQVIILDPEGEFATLREKVDLALVGKDGEMATDVRSASMLARKLVELRIPAIIDLYDLRLDQRRSYVRQFLDSLMNVPRQHWHPLLVVLDEAHVFAPERASGESESTQAVIALMSQGRKRGFSGLLSTQRLSKLHKDAAAESNNVVIGRTWLDVDQTRAGDLLGMNKADRSVLRDLEPGEFFAFGPAFQSNGVVRFRSDTVATTHPKAGARHNLSVPEASATIQEVVKQIGDLPAQAEQEAKDIAALKQENQTLKRQLAQCPVQQRVEQVVQKVEVPVFKDGEVDALKELSLSLNQVSENLASQARGIVAALQAASKPSPMPKAIWPVAPMTAQLTRRSQPAPSSNGDLKLRDGERRMLQALGQRYPARYTRSQLGTLSGFAPRGGTFQTYFGVLKRAGLIVEQGDEVSITPEGMNYLGADIPAAPTSTAEMLTMWRNRLRAGEVNMLNTLVDHYPQWVMRTQLGDMTGFTASGGTFQTYLGVLRRNGLIESQNDLVRASPSLFIGD